VAGPMPRRVDNFDIAGVRSCGFDNSAAKSAGSRAKASSEVVSICVEVFDATRDRRDGRKVPCDLRVSGPGRRILRSHKHRGQ